MSAERGNLPAVLGTTAPVSGATLHRALATPSMVANAGDRAVRRFLEFFAASVENDNTLMACSGLSARTLAGSNSTASEAVFLRHCGDGATRDACSRVVPL